MTNPVLDARRRLGVALTEWRDAGAHPESVVFAIEDLLKGTGPREPDNSMVICPNCTSQFVAIPVDKQTEIRELQEHIALAWGIIANVSGGDWDKQSADWREAATKWELARNPYAYAASAGGLSE